MQTFHPWQFLWARCKNLHKNKLHVHWQAHFRIWHVVWLAKRKTRRQLTLLKLKWQRHATLRWYFWRIRRCHLKLIFVFESLWIWSWMSDEICRTYTLVWTGPQSHDVLLQKRTHDCHPSKLLWKALTLQSITTIRLSPIIRFGTLCAPPSCYEHENLTCIYWCAWNLEFRSILTWWLLLWVFGPAHKRVKVSWRLHLLLHHLWYVMSLSIRNYAMPTIFFFFLM